MAIARYEDLAFEFDEEYIDARTLPELSHEEAKIMLFKTQEIFKEAGIDIYLAFGTLLGAIREGDFIKGDSDADVYARSEREVFENLSFFQSRGLKLVRYCPNYEFTFRYNETKKYFIDVFVLGKPKGVWKLYCYKLADWYVPKRYVDKDETIVFLGKNFKVAKTPKRLLKFWYGKTWNIPVGKFDGKFKYDVYSHIYYLKFKKTKFGLFLRDIYRYCFKRKAK